ncbi:hypothetical protein [Aquihabitans sp. McL0605]|uniref:hypothetical protein n=1 Tax=Aquihabitans sp. McL0605 TaxID=3415671 RepID=UPI003CF37311
MTELPPRLRAKAEEARRRQIAGEPAPPIRGVNRWMFRWLLLPPPVGALVFAAVMAVPLVALPGVVPVPFVLIALVYLGMLLTLIGVRRRLPPAVVERVRDRLN